LAGNIETSSLNKPRTYEEESHLQNTHGHRVQTDLCKKSWVNSIPATALNHGDGIENVSSGMPTFFFKLLRHNSGSIIVWNKDVNHPN